MIAKIDSLGGLKEECDNGALSLKEGDYGHDHKEDS